jgi:hypothetical protein
LQQRDGAAGTVDRPLDVLRAPVVALDAARELAELLQLVIAQALNAPPLFADRDRLDPACRCR